MVTRDDSFLLVGDFFVILLRRGGTREADLVDMRADGPGGAGGMGARAAVRDRVECMYTSMIFLGI